MCGIVGIFRLGEKIEKEPMLEEVMLFLFTELMASTEIRGKDATGVSALFDDGAYLIQKAGKKASEFLTTSGKTEKDYRGFLKMCKGYDEPMRNLVGHCRKSSVGNTWDNENNHPVRAGEIIGVHNGTLKNHEIIFDKLKCKRDGVVDSEAIFRLVQHYTQNCKEPFTTEILAEVVRRLDGTYSCISYNANNPFQVALMRKGRPMELALLSQLKLLLVFSEYTFLTKTIAAYNRFAQLYPANMELITTIGYTTSALLDNSVAVVDLTKDATTIPDLLIKKDTMSLKKLWAKPATVYSSNKTFNKTNTGSYTRTTYNNGGRSASSQRNTESAKSNTGSKHKNDEFAGKVFCKKLHMYVSPEEAQEAAKAGVVGFNYKGTIIDLTKNDEAHPDNTDGRKVVIDMDEKQQLVLAARDSRKARTRFESDADLVQVLKLHSEETLRYVEPYMVANMCMKHLYEEAFLEGALYYKSHYMTQSNLKNKLQSAQRIIKAAKSLINILTLAAEINKGDDEIIEAVSLSFEACEKDNSNIGDTLSKFISEGDFMGSKALKVIKSKVER